MRKEFWIVVTVISVFMGFLIGYCIGPYSVTSVQGGGGSEHVEESGGYK